MADDTNDSIDDDVEPTDAAEVDLDASPAVDDDLDASTAVDDDAADAAPSKEAPAEPAMVRKKVTSKRVTPKGATQGAKVTSSPVSAKARAAAGARTVGGEDDDHEPGFSKRYTPPKATYADGPSPWWVPALMFGLLIIGGLVIMLNYMQVFGDPANIRLVIGLAFILGGIITATQYR